MTMVKGQRQLGSHEKMSRVLKAARRLFVKHGYHNVSIPRIVQESGVSTGAIYNYFTNKETLARQIHQETLDNFLHQFQERLAERTDTESRLRAFSELIFEITEQDPEMMEYMLFMKHGEFMSDMPPICFTEPFKLLRQIIADGMEEGSIKESDIFVSAISYSGVILRGAELRLMCVLQTPLTEIAEELMQNAWAAVRN